MKTPRYDGAMALVCLFISGYTLSGYLIVRELICRHPEAGAWLGAAYLVGLVVLICSFGERGL